MPLDFAGLAEATRERRGELELSQRAFAAACGLAYSTIQEIESGDRQRLSQTTKKRLEIGLRWSAGDVDRVLKKLPPRPAPAEPDESAEPVEPMGIHDPHLDAEELAVQRLVELMPRLPPRLRTEVSTAIARATREPDDERGDDHGEQLSV